MKRGLMPCLQAGMQLPLPLHTSAQRIASSLPAPPVIRSTIAPAVAARIGVGDAGRLGHRAGAKAIAATRAGIGDRRAARPERVEKTGSVLRAVHAETSAAASAPASGSATASCFPNRRIALSP